MRGLKKMIDIVIRWFNFSRYCLYHFFRYWEESRGEGGEVVDEFPDLHEVGHEPADMQVKHIMDMLEKSNIAAAKMVCLQSCRKLPGCYLKLLKQQTVPNLSTYCRIEAFFPSHLRTFLSNFVATGDALSV